MAINNSKAKSIKKQFPIFNYNPGLIYLDNAATTQKPEEVIRVVNNFYSRDYANIHRGLYRLSEKATELYLKSKEIVANFISANPEEIIYTRGTTESVNFLSYVIKGILPRGKKEIVLTEMEHHSNLIPWQQFAKRHGFRIKFIKINKDTLMPDLEDAEKKITKKTAFVSMVWISNSFGSVNPIKQIIKITKEKSGNALIFVDAAQAVSRIPINVKKIDCDFIAFSGHKIFGPTGIGVLYGKKLLLEKMPPFHFGGEMIKKVTLKNSTFANIPERFEAGTQNIVGAIGLGKAIRFIEKIGVENINDWEKKLSDYAIEKLSEISDLEIYTPKKYSGIISFNLNNIHPHDTASMLDNYGITIRAGHHCTMPLMDKLGLIGKGKGGTCRASFSVYNTFEDIDAFAEALKKIKEKFKDTN